MLTQAALAALTLTAPAEPQAVYQPPGSWAWDFWFIQEGDTWHAFHLETPQCVGDPKLTGQHKDVGHATSTDLVHWTYHGRSLIAIRGTWNDLSIATGSVIQKDGRYWMAFTGHGSQNGGFGMAVSDDLMTWEKLGDGPVVPFRSRCRSEWQGQTVTWRAIADPYLYPEVIDGWVYMVLNAQVDGVDISECGCLAMMRSKDMLTWEPAGILTWPRWWERLETPQLWQHDGRWYLYFGGAHDHGVPETYRTQAGEAVQKYTSRGNFVFRADALLGPYEPVGTWWLDVPGGVWGYIMKFMPGPGGGEVMTITLGDRSLSKPYRVSYEADGSVTIQP